MSRGTFMGYEIAPREQQRKIALILLALPMLILGGAYGAFVGPTVYKTWTYQQVPGKVTAIEDKCHYSVARISRRGGRSYLTDLVNCDVARAKAAEVGHATGDIREITIVHVAYAAADGTPMTSWFDIPAEAARDLRIGDGLALMHHPDHPHRVERVPTNAFALNHEARYAGSVAVPLADAPASGTSPQTSTPAPASHAPTPAPAQARKKFQLAKPGEEPSTTEKVARVIAWIVLAVIGAAIIALPWLLWRLLRGVIRRKDRPASDGRSAPQSAIAARRLASVSRQQASATGGRKPRMAPTR